MISPLRLAGILCALLVLASLISRRRQAVLLGRIESLGWPISAALLVVSVWPDAANILTKLTGFEGQLARITSLLVFAVLGLSGWVLFVQGQLSETRLRLLGLLRNMAVQEGLEGADRRPAEVILIMPALNEAENLAKVLPEAPTTCLGMSVRIVVVDDGSEDDTVGVAAAHGALPVKTPINVGGGHALQVGFAVARRLGARFVVTMDADGQHRFEDLPTLLAPLQQDQADFTIGSRNLGQSVGHEAVRALGIRVFNAILSFLTGRPITDCSSGYRAFRLDRLSRLRLIQDRHHTAETIIEAARAGLRIQEVPITILPRIHGESRKGTNWRYGVRFARTVLSSWWRG